MRSRHQSRYAGLVPQGMARWLPRPDCRIYRRRHCRHPDVHGREIPGAPLSDRGGEGYLASGGDTNRAGGGDVTPAKLTWSIRSHEATHTLSNRFLARSWSCRIRWRTLPLDSTSHRHPPMFSWLAEIQLAEPRRSHYLSPPAGLFYVGPDGAGSGDQYLLGSRLEPADADALSHRARGLRAALSLVQF